MIRRGRGDHVLRRVDPQRRQPNISRARTILNWEPKVNLEDGIRQTIPYFKRELGLA